MRRALGVLLAMQVSGCSLVFTREPRFEADRPAERAECTESRTAPNIDAGLAVALYASALALIGWGVSSGGGEAGAMRVSASVGPAAYGTIAAVSAAVGYGRTRRCERVHDLQRRCLEGERAACAELQSVADDRTGR